MTTMIVPPLEETPWPSLGQQVCRFIEQNLIHGPGDLRGQPARLDAEKRLLLYRMYEVYPEDHPQAGRRRFRRVAISLRKGTAKTEFAAWIAAVELHPEGPVRCDGFRGGQPIGRPVTDPYIPMVAYTEEQTEELAYGALHTILSEGPLADDFDIGLSRIMRKKGGGKAEALASSPDARDGARTTFEHFDETHRFTLPRLKEAYRTMIANLPKRKLADPWALATTTAYSIGEDSIAEAAMTEARAIIEGQRADTRLFFYHRQADSDSIDLGNRDEVRKAIVDASGPDVAEWSDIDGIVDQFDDPTADFALLQRLWLNIPIAGGGKAFPIDTWHELKQVFAPPQGDMITLGFDGSRFGDATALIATHVESGYQWPIGIWTPPVNPKATAEEKWEVDRRAVNDGVEAAFDMYDVIRMHADPPEWTSELSEWEGKYGDKRVIWWWTRRTTNMAYALKGYRIAMVNHALSHNGDPLFTQHIANSVRREETQRDEDDSPLWTIRKERPNSIFKIDAAMAGCLSWDARMAAVAEGVLAKPKGISLYISGETAPV